MAVKWRGKGTDVLGEFGESIGREIEAWKGAGLLEKKEGVLLWNSEGKEEDWVGNSLWTSGFSPGC